MNEMYNTLKEFCAYIKQLVDKKRRNKEIKAKSMLFVAKTYDNRYSGHIYEKESWLGTDFILLEELCKTKEYDDILRLMRGKVDETKLPYYKSLLNEFINKVKGFIPRNSTLLSIAYERYCDALFDNKLIEKRIASVIMGLEALLLRGSERNELSFRLKLRISKLYALLDLDKYCVRRAIKDGYNIRSLFVHGGQLNDNAKNYSDLNIILFECLRIMLIIFMVSKKNKDELISLIDDALIDDNKEETLSNLVLQIKPLI